VRGVFHDYAILGACRTYTKLHAQLKPIVVEEILTVAVIKQLRI
jgi:hypothetical protein